MVIGKYVFLAFMLWLSIGVSSWAESSVLLDNDRARKGLRGPVSKVLTYQEMSNRLAYPEDFDPSLHDGRDEGFGLFSSLTFDQQGSMVKSITYDKYAEYWAYERLGDTIKLLLKAESDTGETRVREGKILSQADLVVYHWPNDEGVLVTSVVTKYNGSNYDASTVYYDVNRQPWTATPSSTAVIRSSATGRTKTVYIVSYDRPYKTFYIHRLNEWGDAIHSISFSRHGDEPLQWMPFNETMIEMAFRYEYDDHQNWIKLYDVESGALFQYREIEYYE